MGVLRGKIYYRSNLPLDCIHKPNYGDGRRHPCHGDSDAPRTSTTSEESVSGLYSSGNKRKRSGDTTNNPNHNDTPIASTPPSLTDLIFVPIHANDNNDDDNDDVVGRHCPPDHYLLSLPECLKEISHNAALHAQIVELMKYTIVTVTLVGRQKQQRRINRNNMDTNTDISSSTFPIPFLDGHRHHNMIEVHRGGLRVLYSKQNCNNHNNNCEVINDNNSNNNLWTLPQFWRKELVDAQLDKLESSTTATTTTTIGVARSAVAAKPSRHNKRPFHLVAAVEAVSPIIVWNTSDPNQHFAMIELYDPRYHDRNSHGENNSIFKAVLVLKGTDALKWHSSLVSSLRHDDINGNDDGMIAIFRNVICTRWKVPEELFGKKNSSRSNKRNEGFDVYTHLQGRIPSKVFVASEQFSVERIGGNEQGMSVPRKASQRHTIMSTPLITNIRGKLIRDAETISVSSRSQTANFVHFVDLIDECDNGIRKSGRRHRVFLTHYPMSTIMQWSLRKGAVVECMNVHSICGETEFACHCCNASNECKAKQIMAYGACLRSSIVVIATAGEATAETVKRTKPKQPERHERQHGSSQSTSSLTSTPVHRQNLPQTQESTECDLEDSKSTCLGSSYNHPGQHIIQFHAESWLPYAFWKVRKTYLYYHFQHQVEKWVEGHLCNTVLSSSKKAQLVKILLATSQHNRASSLQTTSIPSRDPYAEFFDHHCYNDMNADVVNSLSTSEQVSCGCHLSMVDRNLSSHETRHVALTSLSQLRRASQEFVISRITKMLSVPTSSDFYEEIQPGWIGSVSAAANEILETKHERNSERASNTLFLIGGYVGECRSYPFGVTALYDAWFQIPVCFSSGDEQASINDFIIGAVERVSVACCCLGSRRIDSEAADDNDFGIPCMGHQVDLPSFGSADKGGCSILEVNGFIFLTAIHIECRDAQLLASPNNDECSDVHLHRYLVSVDECLKSPPNHFQGHHPHAKVKGILVRNTIKSSSKASGSSSCQLTISSSHSSYGFDSKWLDSSCLQSINMRLSLEHNTARLIAFNKALDTHWQSVDITERQRTLGTCFWTLGNCGRAIAITLGGYEEENHCSSRDFFSFTTIFVPSSAVHVGKGGSMQLECGLDGLESSRLTVRQRKETSYNLLKGDSCNTPCFDFVGGKKFLTGMLYRRIERRNIFATEGINFRTVGEISSQVSPAIPTCTIYDMIQSLCEELRDSSRCSLRPSLTRRVSCCRFLGVSYCEVRCACMKCFRPLTCSASEMKKKKLNKDGEGTEEPTFWHIPPPLVSSLEHHRTLPMPSSKNDQIPHHIRQSHLSCPNKCPKKFHGVKWECSGVLDDGTGQAQLYTERDTALTLLGMPAEHIQGIEHGVWFTTNGILKVQKTMAPSKELRDNVKSLCRNRSTVVDPIRILPPQLRAEYLLEHHCRSSTRSRRPLDYYVRCKSLDRKFHLEHGTVESFFGDGAVDRVTALHRGETSTYKLPRLNLQLVDCGIPTNEYTI
jgi:hypothetical protein